jgi:hypothetical protein
MGGSQADGGYIVALFEKMIFITSHALVIDGGRIAGE